MRTASIILTLLVICLPSASHAACIADQYGGLVCGEGKDAVRVVSDTTSPSKKLAFGWRTPVGLPTGHDLPMDPIENVLIRLDDGKVLTKLGGEYWATGEATANRYDQVAAWTPDSRAVVEVSNNRWDSESFAYYAVDGDSVTKLDLRAVVEPVLKAKLPASKREDYAFRVREDKPVKLDGSGHLGFTVMLYVPKSDPEQDYEVAVDISTKAGKPAARIASTRRVKAD